ncbi:MAG: leucine-rich repeat protein [Eubacteriaceae bacterium]|jgi:hypothetical protein|nr:leucine-rich repeat protein [Eubacteriaceae bacterium]
MKTGGMIKKVGRAPGRLVLPVLLAALIAIFMCTAVLSGSDAYAMSRPGKVRGITASVQSDTYIAVTWQKAAHAGGYIVYRASAGGYKRVKKLTSGKSTRFDDASLKADTQYSYYVKAYRRSDGRTVYGRPSQKVKSVTDAGDPTCEESIYKDRADSDGFCTIDGVLYAYIGTAESVTVPDNVREIASDAFSGDLEEGHEHGKNLREVIIPGSVKKIDGRAFAFTNADVIEIREGVEQIGNAAFMDSYINKISFPASLTKIGWGIMETEEGLEGTEIYVVKGSAIYKYFKRSMPYGDATLKF